MRGQLMTGGVPLWRSWGAHLVRPGRAGVVVVVGGSAMKFVFVCLWIERQNGTAALTRVLKGCVKAADWGTRDSVEQCGDLIWGGGVVVVGWKVKLSNVKSQSKGIRERLQHSQTPAHKCLTSKNKPETNTNILSAQQNHFCELILKKKKRN